MDNKNPWYILGVVGALGAEVIFLAIAGGWLGNKLDAVGSTKPLFVIIGICVGVGLGFLGAYYTLKKMVKDD